MASTSADTPVDATTVYIDEKVGSDDAGDGSIQKPYQSPAQAIVNHGPSPPLVIMTRKSEEEEWAAIGISALKKARKGAEGIEKKKQKALAAEAKAADKAAAQEKSKDVVLEEDSSLPQAVKVSKASSCATVACLTRYIDKDQILGETSRTTSQSLRLDSSSSLAGQDDIRRPARRDRVPSSDYRGKVGTSAPRRLARIY